MCVSTERDKNSLLLKPLLGSLSVRLLWPGCHLPISSVRWLSPGQRCDTSLVMSYPTNSSPCLAVSRSHLSRGTAEGFLARKPQRECFSCDLGCLRPGYGMSHPHCPDHPRQLQPLHICTLCWDLFPPTLQTHPSPRRCSSTRSSPEVAHQGHCCLPGLQKNPGN